MIFFLLVIISPSDHIQNKEPGRCAWCALETLGRTHGWKNLHGLTEKNARAAQREDMVAELDKYKIRYQVQYPSETRYFYYVMREDFDDKPYPFAIRESKKEANHILHNTKIKGRWWLEKKTHWDITFLRKAINEDLGCAVSLDRDTTHTRHMVVLTDMTTDMVKLIDSNYSPGKIREMPIHVFLDKWNGFAIIIERKTK